MDTSKMLILFYEFLDMTSDAFKITERPVTDLTLRLLNESYIETLDDFCRTTDFVSSVQKVRANLEVLRELVIEEEVTFSTTSIPEIYTVDIADLTYSYNYLIRMVTEIQRSAVPIVSSGTPVETRPLHETETDAYETTVYNKPIIRTPGITFADGNFKIYCDTYTTLDYVTITYIKTPEELTLDPLSKCLLQPENICNDIVKRAVDKFLRSKNIALNQKTEE